MNIYIYITYCTVVLHFFCPAFLNTFPSIFFYFFQKLVKCIYLFFCINVSIFLTFFIYTFSFPTPGPRTFSLSLYSLSWFMLSFYRYIKVRVIQVLGTGPQVGKGGHPCIGKCDDQKCTKVFK